MEDAKMKHTTGKSKWIKYGASFLLVLAALIVPTLVNNYYLSILIEIVLYAYLASAWNVLGGFASPFSSNSS